MTILINSSDFFIAWKLVASLRGVIRFRFDSFGKTIGGAVLFYQRRQWHPPPPLKSLQLLFPPHFEGSDTLKLSGGFSSWLAACTWSQSVLDL